MRVVECVEPFVCGALILAQILDALFLNDPSGFGALRSHGAKRLCDHGDGGDSNAQYHITRKTPSAICFRFSCEKKDNEVFNY